MDFIESSRSQWSGRYSWGDENSANEGLTLDGTKLLTNYEQYTGSNTRTFTPNLVNEARFGYTRFFNSVGTYLAFDTDVVGQIGIPNLKGGDPVTWGIPGVGLTGYSGFGDSSEGPYVNRNKNLQFVDTMSWIKGKHAFRFGGEYMRQIYNQIGNQFARGAFTFQANATLSPTLSGGDAFAEYLLGTLYQSDVAVAVATANFQRNLKHAWFDDTWKVTPKLTLSLGLRYELNPPFYDTLGNLVTVYLPHINFQPQAPLSDYPKMMRQGDCTDPYGPGVNIQWPQITTVCSNGILSKELMRTHYKDFAPRVGIAYSPNAKWVIRAGFGMFYNQDQGNAVFDMARQIAGRLRVTNQVAGTANVFWNNALAAVVSGAKPQITNPQGFVNAYSHQSTYTVEYLLNIQRQLTNNLVVEGGYLGSASRHLYGFQDANPKTPGTTPLATRTPFSNFSVIQLVHDGGVGNYNAASIKLTQRYSHGLSLISNYTYSKSIDTTSGIRVQGFDQLFPQNSFCLNPCERGLSSFHVKNRFILSALYDLPVGKGRSVDIKNGFLNAVIGGWQTGGIWTAQSGLPQAVVTGSDRSNTSLGYDRPNATGLSPYLSNPTPSLWFNPAAFVAQPLGTFGNLGRNTVVGPGTFALDFALHKEFPMPFNERHRLQFRLEAFNVMNHPVWSNPNGNIAAGAPYPDQPATSPRTGFGRITATAVPMRQVQLALKYAF